MAVLGIDWGERRIGLAVSDPEGIIATPIGKLDATSRKRDIAAIRALVEERGITEIVVGLPIHMDGRRGEAAEAATRFAADLSAALELPVETLDERWTTAEADRALQEGGRSGRRRRRESIDSMAATILLRTYLEIRRSRTEPAHS
ncbi:MAG: Holliday junction resolvase RuvX [Myxococcota bacterium]